MQVRLERQQLVVAGVVEGEPALSSDLEIGALEIYVWSYASTYWCFHVSPEHYKSDVYRI